LLQSADKKGTYSDYLRLLEFYREASGAEGKQILAGWIESEIGMNHND
jgi:hypothetical protein